MAFFLPHRELFRTSFGGAAQPSFAFVAMPEALTAVPVGAEERPSLRDPVYSALERLASNVAATAARESFKPAPVDSRG